MPIRRFAIAAGAVAMLLSTAMGNVPKVTPQAATGHLFWSAVNAQTITKASLNGSDPRTVVSGQDVEGIVVYRDHLYWTDYGNGSPGTGAVDEASLDGGHPKTLISGLYQPMGLAVANGHIYWAECTPATINEANLNGTNPHAIITSQPTTACPLGVAATASHIYWTNYGGPDSVNEANLDGTNPHAIITGQPGPVGITVHGNHLYWTVQGSPSTSTSGTIDRADLGGSGLVTLVTGQWWPWALAFTSNHMYWTTNEGGTVSDANLNGSDPQTVVNKTGADNFQGIAVSP
jgi:hypothetical protein